VTQSHARGALVVALLLALAFAIGVVAKRRLASTEQMFMPPLVIPVVVSGKDRLNGGTPSLFHVNGTVDGHAVAFDIQILNDWATKQHPLGGELPTVEAAWGTAELQSTGVNSDNLLRVLEGRFGLQPSGRRLRAVVRATGVSLTSHPSKIASELVELKLFLGQEGADNYAEVFLSINLRRGHVVIDEKDLAYRSGLLAQLAE